MNDLPKKKLDISFQQPHIHPDISAETIEAASEYARKENAAGEFFSIPGNEFKRYISTDGHYWTEYGTDNIHTIDKLFRPLLNSSANTDRTKTILDKWLEER